MFGQTDEQRNNLNKLADYLINLPEDYKHFDMRGYATDNNDEDEIPPMWIKDRIDDCGTIACAIGHGPCAGVDPGPIKSWMYYSQEKLGIRWGTDEFNYLFGHKWVKIDNTPRGAGL